MLKEDSNIMFAKWVSLKQARTSGKLVRNTYEKRHLEVSIINIYIIYIFHCRVTLKLQKSTCILLLSFFNNTF
jgi:hypothetical protein